MCTFTTSIHRTRRAFLTAGAHFVQIGLIVALTPPLSRADETQRGGVQLSTLSVQQEEAAKRLEGKLIAPCCFSQTVANHYSDVAAHMKQQIRQFLAQGQREDQILDAYVRVYGERILAEPQARGFNLLAYLAPPLATVAGMGGLLFMLRQWRRSAFMHQLIRQQPVARQDENFQFYRARLRDELERFSG